MQLVWAGAALAEGLLDERLALRDEGAVPPAAILVGQQDQVTVGADPGVPPSVASPFRGRQGCWFQL